MREDEGEEAIPEETAVRAVFLWGAERRGSVSVTPCSLRRDERGDRERMGGELPSMAAFGRVNGHSS